MLFLAQEENHMLLFLGCMFFSPAQKQNSKLREDNVNKRVYDKDVKQILRRKKILVRNLFSGVGY